MRPRMSSESAKALNGTGVAQGARVAVAGDNVTEVGARPSCFHPRDDGAGCNHEGGAARSNQSSGVIRRPLGSVGQKPGKESNGRGVTGPVSLVRRAAGLERGSTRMLRLCASPAMRSSTRVTPDVHRSCRHEGFLVRRADARRRARRRRCT